MTATCQTSRCLICGGYLTMEEDYGADRCADPGHWLAAGLLAQDDFYRLGRLIASTRSRPVVCVAAPAGDGPGRAEMAGSSYWPKPLRQFFAKFHK